MVTETYQIEHATDHVQRARAYGAEVDLVGCRPDAGRGPLPTYLGAIHDPDVGIVDPARLAWGWPGRRGAGVRIHEHSGVEALTSTEVGMSLRTFGGRSRRAWWR